MTLFEEKDQAEECWDGYPRAAWKKASLAVISSDGDGNGSVVWTAGPHLRMEIKESGLKALGDLGLDDAPRGITVWEGRILYSTEGEPYDTKGAFRDPTDEEWDAIREKRCPWNDQDWR